MSGPAQFLTCSVNVGSHLVASSVPMASAASSPIASSRPDRVHRIPNVSRKYPCWRPADMLLSLSENTISSHGGRMTHKVLVTGGFGLVGTQTVERLVGGGHTVVVADLETPANRKKAGTLPEGATVHWTDLTDAGAVDRLVADVSPSVIVHLAAVIPPPLYRNPGLARKVNVEATMALVRAAEAQSSPPRFVQASSNAVYGS